MNMMEATKVCLSKYFQFSGRARRAEYWWFYFVTVIVSIVLGFVDGVMSLAPNGLTVLSTIWSLVTLIPSMAAGSRRLHDTDRSGWWQLLWVFPMVALLMPFVFLSIRSGNEGLLIVALIVFVVAAIVLLVWLATKGTQGPNRFGADPLRSHDVGEVFA